MKRLALLAGLALLTGTSCWPFQDGESLSPMSVERSSGKGAIQVIRGEETIEVQEDEVSIRPQDVVRTEGDAEARIRLEGDREALINSRGRVRVVNGSTLQSQSGSLLAAAGSAMKLRVGNVEVGAADSVARVDQGFASARVAAYRGRVTIMAPGEDRLEISRLFQASVTAGDLPRTPSPYRLDGADAWDRVYLEDVIALDERLGRLRDGFQSQVGSRIPRLPYFKGLAGGREVGFLAGYLRQRIPAADLLIGFEVARLADRSLKAETARAFDLYRRGARWGVTAGIMRVEQRPLLAALNQAIVATRVVGENTGGEAVFVVASSGSTPGGSDSPGPGKDQAGGGSPGPGPSPSPTAPGCEPGDIACTIEDIVDPSPSPTNLLDGLIGADG